MCKVDHDECQDVERAEMAAKNFDVVRSKIFNFHSVTSVIIVELKMQ